MSQPPPSRPPDDKPNGGLIVIRTSRKRKGAYVRAAGGQKLVAWMLMILDRAANYKE